MTTSDTIYVNINREEAADLINQLVRMLERDKRDISFQLSKCAYGDDVFYISNRDGDLK